jgi:hypothetical protein
MLTVENQPTDPQEAANQRWNNSAGVFSGVCIVIFIILLALGVSTSGNNKDPYPMAQNGTSTTTPTTINTVQSWNPVPLPIVFAQATTTSIPSPTTTSTPVKTQVLMATPTANFTTSHPNCVFIDNASWEKLLILVINKYLTPQDDLVGDFMLVGVNSNEQYRFENARFSDGMCFATTDIVRLFEAMMTESTYKPEEHEIRLCFKHADIDSKPHVSGKTVTLTYFPKALSISYMNESNVIVTDVIVGDNLALNEQFRPQASHFCPAAKTADTDENNHLLTAFPGINFDADEPFPEATLEPGNGF